MACIAKMAENQTKSTKISACVCIFRGSLSKLFLYGKVYTCIGVGPNVTKHKLVLAFILFYLQAANVIGHEVPLT